MKYHNQQFPNEPAEYRKKRFQLLEQEIELRSKVESLAKLRSELPLGGKLSEDYLFETLDSSGKVIGINFSELFTSNKNTLAIYSFMYSSDMENACPACTSLLDGLNGSALHIKDRINFVAIAKSPIERINSFSKSRNWDELTLLSSAKNTYNKDYFAENDQGNQIPALNIFTKTKEGIFHFYNTELLYVNLKGHPRHVDMLWPVWNMLDMTPKGRGTDWFPKLSYE